jgi:hypothetical protein
VAEVINDERASNTLNDREKTLIRGCRRAVLKTFAGCLADDSPIAGTLPAFSRNAFTFPVGRVEYSLVARVIFAGLYLARLPVATQRMTSVLAHVVRGRDVFLRSGADLVDDLAGRVERCGGAGSGDDQRHPSPLRNVVAG